MDNVAHHQIIHGDFCLGLLYAGDSAGGGNHRQQLFRRIAASGFLDKAKGAGNQHHGENDDDRQGVKILRHAAQQGKVGENHVRHGGHQRQAEQNGGEGVDERPGKPLGEGLFLFMGHHVAAKFGAAEEDGSGVQTAQGGV